ncbi:Zinc finger transcription factor YRR1 [Termitomyces sp. J132]|nr:Zinc finger transcription factor YRR1 [Termitomyces sp. J132]
MPRTPSAATPSSSRPALRRNQACRSCRKKKLKCDAARPHCGTCVRTWQNLISVPAPVGYAHPTEPSCSYDPVEGLTLAPDVDPLEKIKQLEDQISHLKSRLYEHEMRFSSVSSHQSPNLLYPDTTSPASTSSRPISDIRGISLPHVSLSMMNTVAPSSPEQPFRVQSRTSENLMNNSTNGQDTSNHFIDLLFPASIFSVLSQRRAHEILHRSSFLASMRLPPKDPGFPHSAILHAICASASRWSPQNVITLPDGSRRDQFAEFHANKTRQYIDKTMASGEDIFFVMQACILLSWYFYQEGRWVEVWIFAAFQTRVAVPLRLNYPGTFSTHGNNSPGAYLPPPKDLRDLESRRRTWWMTILFDRIASVGGWIHAIDERDLGTELPLRIQDFESEAAIPSNPQDISTPDLFTRHSPQYTDSFLLLIKAVMLFGRVTDFNVRGNLRAPTAPSKNQNPYFLEGFEKLDKLISSDFLQSLPQIFKNNTGLGVTDAPEGTRLDTDLYMVHIIPHAATITLHNPYIDFTNPQSVSTKRCVDAARRILSAYYALSATSLDISRLHPFVTICWYLAAVVQIQLCKYFIELGDTERESAVWGDINVLRFAMMEYGHRSPIGVRQERLLQGLMREIVRMTAHKQPLEVGVPLYPFSHQTLFQKNEHSGPVPLSSTGHTFVPSSHQQSLSSNGGHWSLSG